MKMRFPPSSIALLAVAMVPFLVLSLEDEDAHSVGCLPKATVQEQWSVCAGCHKDATSRWESNRNRPCTPYCMNCHRKAQMDRHHRVGVELPTMPDQLLRLTADRKNACFTCHDLSRPRYDGVRWKAASLYDRMFHPEKRYKTYFLVERNDQGQLCLSCH
jgi:hypothetical protein